jgi:hypothetical protein
MRIFLVILILIAVSSAADIVGKQGETAPARPPGNPGEGSSIRSDFEFNTFGAMNCPATMAGSAEGWGEWFITTLQNDSGHALRLRELAFPCTGPPSGNFGWLVWTNLDGPGPPRQGPASADFSGVFTPALNDSLSPPSLYTEVNLESAEIDIGEGAWFAIGYDVTHLGGQVVSGGPETWSWYGLTWDPDSQWGRAALIQVRADFEAVATERSSWSDLKRLY